MKVSVGIKIIEDKIFSGGDCEVCRKVVEIVAQEILNSIRDFNEKKIVEAMRRECRKMHGFEHKCMNFINKDVKKFVVLLKMVVERSITATELCQIINICVSTEGESDEFESLQMQNELTDISFTSECLVCTSLMHIVLKQIDDRIDENKIMAIMRRECRAHKWNSFKLFLFLLKKLSVHKQPQYHNDLKYKSLTPLYMEIFVFICSVH